MQVLLPQFFCHGIAFRLEDKTQCCSLEGGEGRCKQRRCRVIFPGLKIVAASRPVKLGPALPFTILDAVQLLL